MKPERAFIAERPLAAHCPELLRKGPAPEELLPLLGRMGERLARRLAGALAPLLGGEAPPVSCSPPREGDLAQLRSGIAPLAANSLFGVGAGGGGAGASPLLVSIEAEPVLRIVDTAFGGKGEAPCPLPAAFPMAAELMIGRIEGLLASHISAAVAAITTATASPARGPSTEPPAITPLRRDGSLAMLSPFAEHAPLAIMTLEVEDGSVLPWLVTLAMPLGTLARLFGYPDSGPAHASAGPAPRRAGNPDTWPTTGPCAGIPLPLRAVIVDMPISFATLATLEPGQILPVSVARRVPLRVGEHTIAHGTPGALDEHIAIQITDAF